MRGWTLPFGETIELVAAAAALATAAITAVLAFAAIRQLELIERQISALAQQIKIAQEAESANHKRIHEWETLKACQCYDFQTTIDGANARIWRASDHGTDYTKADIRDVKCVMNYLDGIGIGVDQGLYLEPIVRDHLSPIFKHAVEKLMAAKLVKEEDFQHVGKYYRRWFGEPPPTSYRSEPSRG